MGKVFTSVFESTIGPIYIASTEKGICNLTIPAQNRSDFARWLKAHVPTNEIVESETNNRQVEDELARYFARKLVKFHTPVDMIGTEFEKRVWEELKTIRYGMTISYKELARRVGTPNGFQSVGRANAANPLPIIIPCHRVLGVNGALTGYAGGIKTKEFLLRLEGALLL